MELDDLAQVVFGVGVAIVVGTMAVFAFWRARSMFRIWQAGARQLHSTRATIWRDPGAVESLDLAAGPGGQDGAPEPPFAFIEEHLGGSQPCVSVRDRRGRVWRVKWGHEVQVETLATRLAWAAGYFVEICYYVAAGHIAARAMLRRATEAIDPEGRFTAARFELDDPAIIKHFDEHSWAWHDNPFVGSRELNGLKIVMMWLSNWDAKDVRDVARGSNTAIFEVLTDRRIGAPPRSPLSDHRLGRRARPLGQHRPPRPLGLPGLWGRERSADRRRGRRSRPLRLHRSADGRHRRPGSASVMCAG